MFEKRCSQNVENYLDLVFLHRVFDFLKISSYTTIAWDFHGICDGAIFTENEVIPLEFKLSEVSPPMGARLQLAAYAMLLEYQEKIKYQGDFDAFMARKVHTLEVIVDIKLRAEVLTVANLIRKACKKAIVPHTAATESQCAQCEYQNFCADRF